MRIAEFQGIVAAVDPAARRYWSAGRGEPYTFWEESRQLPLTSDDAHTDEGWVFYVHRFSTVEDDPIADALFSALDSHPAIAVSREVSAEPDTGYIHTVLTCEVV